MVDRHGTPILPLVTADITQRVAIASGLTVAELRGSNASGVWPSKAAYDRARRAANALAAEAQD